MPQLPIFLCRRSLLPAVVYTCLRTTSFRFERAAVDIAGHQNPNAKAATAAVLSQSHPSCYSLLIRMSRRPYKKRCWLLMQHRNRPPGIEVGDGHRRSILCSPIRAVTTFHSQRAAVLSEGPTFGHVMVAAEYHQESKAAAAAFSPLKAPSVPAVDMCIAYPLSIRKRLCLSMSPL